MADLRISELAALAGGNLAAGDLLAVVDNSASETKKITVTDLVGNATTLIADATIPGAKILFSAGTIAGTALSTSSVSATQLATGAVTASKLADESVVDLVTTLPNVGAFIGQLALDTNALKVYCWDGSTWLSIKAAGSVNTIIGDSSGIVNLNVSVAGDTVNISTSFDSTTSAGQFLAGPATAAGAVTYRTITADDLPTATSLAKGGVSVNGEGLRLDGTQLEIDNDLTASTTYGAVTYNAKGLVTAGRSLISSDLPLATSSAVGGVRPGLGLSVDGTGTINHSNSVPASTYTKVTVDSQGHVTAGSSLLDTDIPNLPGSKLTTGTISNSLLGTNSVTGIKLANYATVQFGGAGSTSGVVTFPVPEFIGQGFFDASNGDYYLYDGNTWQPITVISGDLIYGGTYNASTNKVKSVTTQGSAAGLLVGSALPSASSSNLRYYVVVSDSGTGVAPAPVASLAPPDMLVSNGATWDLIDVSNAIAGQTASNISFTPYSGIAATNVQTALQELEDEKLGKTGGTLTGELLVGTTGSIVFEGSTDNAYETSLAVVDPTADRTITFADVTGTVVTTGDTGSVTGTMLANATVTHGKIANITAGSVLMGNASNIPTATAFSGDITLSSTGVTAIASGVVVDADINASAAIAYSKLASLTAGQILLGNASNVPTATTVTGDVTIDSSGVTSISAGSIVNADINASAAIVDTKLATISTAGKVSGTAITSGNISTSGSFTTSSSITDAAGNVRSIPQNSKTAAYTLVASDTGKHISITTGGVTVPSGVFNTGDVITIFNNSAVSQTITQGTSVTMRQAGTSSTGNRTLALYGVATVLCVASNTFVISGSGLT